MQRKIFSLICLIALIFTLLVVPTSVRAEEEGASHIGSFFLSLLNFPFKLATCIGTQTVASVAYVTTAGVPGNYEGGTNGKQIGEVARGACVGPWVITPEQVKKDYEP